ncbi:MAG: hypothetical protein ACLQU5_15975 [Isosphaeraceae bacterium]
MYIDVAAQASTRPQFLAPNSPAPLQAGPNGKYPYPEPGIKRDREY